MHENFSYSANFQDESFDTVNMHENFSLSSNFQDESLDLENNPDESFDSPNVQDSEMHIDIDILKALNNNNYEIEEPLTIAQQVAQTLKEIEEFNGLHPIPERLKVRTEINTEPKQLMKPVRTRKGRGWTEKEEVSPKPLKIKRKIVQKKIKPMAELQKENVPICNSSEVPEILEESKKNTDEEILDLIESVREKRPLWDFTSKIIRRSPAITDKLWAEVVNDCIGKMIKLVSVLYIL